MTEPLITVGAGFDDVEDGTYDLTCTGVEAKVFPGQVSQYNPEGKDSPVFVWKFIFTGTDQAIEGVTSQMTGPKAKASGWIGALLGPQALQPGATFNAPDFVGKRALGRTEHNAKGYPKVADVFPLPKQAQAVTAVTHPAPPQVEAPAPAAPPAAPVAAPVVEAQAPAPAAAPVAISAPPTSVRAQAGAEDDLPF